MSEETLEFPKEEVSYFVDREVELWKLDIEVRKLREEVEKRLSEEEMEGVEAIIELHLQDEFDEDEVREDERDVIESMGEPMSDEVEVSGYDMQVECPDCGKPVRFNSSEEIVECSRYEGPASGCGAMFRVTVTAESFSDDDDE